MTSASPRRLADEHVGDHVRQMADRGHQSVVSLGVDRLDLRAQAGDRALQPVVEHPAGALGLRRQVPAGTLEEVLARVLHPRGLGARKRVAADEALIGAERRDYVALGRADVGDDRVGTAGVERRRGQLGQSADGRRAEDHVGALAGLSRRVSGHVEDAQLERPLQRRRVGVEPDNLAPQAPPRGQSDRAPDQADAEDGDLHTSPRRASTAAANCSSSVAVVSQSMQGSVIDWP